MTGADLTQRLGGGYGVIEGTTAAHGWTGDKDTRVARVAYQVEALAVNDASGHLGPAHQRQRPGTCQDHQRAVLGERVRLGGRQAPRRLAEQRSGTSVLVLLVSPGHVVCRAG